MRRIVTLLLLVLVGVPMYAGESRLSLLGPSAQFTATPVALAPGTTLVQQVGALRFERGYRLQSPDPSFGGFSSLAVAGDHFTLLSDGGNIVRFRLEATGRLSERGFAEVPAGPGRGWSKEDRDSESLTVDRRTGQIWVGFERANQIWRFSPGLARPQAHSVPGALADWDENGGPEAMVRLGNGHFIVLSETTSPAGKPHARRAVVFSGDPTQPGTKAAPFTYVPPPGYSPTDIAELPRGDLLVLNRRFSWARGFESAVTLVDRRSIAAGSTATAIALAWFAQPLLHDNFEGIAIVPEAHGVGLWIVSDDNQSVVQQTLLLKFRLDDGDVKRCLARTGCPRNP
ncbi:MAG: esterase-like activity of phytase family protein [Sphingomonas sp.]